MKNLRSVTLTTCLATLGSLSIQAQVTGSGSTDYGPLWSGSSALTNSIMYQTSGNIGINTTSPKYALDVTGHINSSLGYLLGEVLVLGSAGGLTGLNNGNISLGPLALQYNTGTENTAVGYESLQQNTSGGGNTAIGYYSLAVNTTGAQNTALGSNSLTVNTGSYNTGLGESTLYRNVGGSQNTAVGGGSLGENTSGTSNTAVGFQALISNYTGSNNIGIGYYAGGLVSYGNSYNIEIGNQGASADNGAIRIGQPGYQTSFFAAGISGVNLSGATVVVNSSGQLGVVTSSRRFKEDIHDMGDSSAGLLRLRPVTFRYKQAYEDGSKPLDYGLIAEEVAEVYPELAVKGADGQIQTIQYQKLTPMLLNEAQKQHRLIEQQAENIRLLQERLEALETAVRAAR